MRGERMNAVARVPSPSILRPSPLILVLLDLESQLRVDVAAVVAGRVGELGVAALGAADVVDRLERLVRTAFALARLADALNGQHGGGLQTSLFWSPAA